MTSNFKNDNKQIGGVKKKNGHKLECNCPICVNIKHAKGGAGFDVIDYEPIKKGGKKSKTNCNKSNCKCLNCKRINCNCTNCNCKVCQSKKNKKTKRVTKLKKSRTSRRK